MRFIYFDLGNVILRFSHDLACENVAAISDVPVDQVRATLFESGLSLKTEDSQISDDELFERFCAETEAQVEKRDFQRAFSDIFTLNESTARIIEQLADQGCSLGILSNTCAVHWDFVTDGRYPVLDQGHFSVHALSFELRSLKPAAEIYSAAAKLAGVPPAEIFFTDDRPENIAGARAAGFDAVLFETATQFCSDLNDRLRRLGKDEVCP